MFNSLNLFNDECTYKFAFNEKHNKKLSGKCSHTLTSLESMYSETLN